MFPILVDLKQFHVGLAGNGAVAQRRLRLIAAERPLRLAVYGPAAEAELITDAGDRLIRRLPSEEELGRLKLLFIADLPPGDAARLAAAARACGVLVNTEDDQALSDFHVPAIVKRGDLTITVSTGGASPALARILRQRLECQYGESWSERLKEVARWRKTWRAEGLEPSEITTHTEVALAERGWLS